MSINFTTARDLVETKIRRNKALVDLLEAETDILKKNILVNYRLAENNRKNVDLIKEINEIEHKQTQTYCRTRENLIKNLTQQVNENRPDVQNLYEDIIALKKKCYELLVQIKTLNDKIPDQTIVTNYKLPIGSDSCRD